MATHFSILAWRLPDSKACVPGVAKTGARLKRLSMHAWYFTDVQQMFISFLYSRNGKEKNKKIK